MTKPYRPFDPQLYFEFRLYREFSSGIPDQWMSHGIDLVHFFMNDQPPRSVMAHGGVFAWHDGRENPDTFQALVEYPSFLASYSTSFGNDSDSFSRIMGKKATLINIGGEGSPRWKLVEEKGNHEDNPNDRARGALGHAPGRRQAGPDQHRRRGPVAHVELVRVPAQPQHADERHRRQRLPAFGGVHHGGAVVLAGQAPVLRCRVGADQGLRACVNGDGLIARGRRLQRTVTPQAGDRSATPACLRLLGFETRHLHIVHEDAARVPRPHVRTREDLILRELEAELRRRTRHARQTHLDVPDTS